MERNRGKWKFGGLLIMSGVFLTYYFYQTLFDTPQVILHHSHNHIKSSGFALRKLHWLEDGVTVEGTFNTTENMTSSGLGDDDDDVECREVLNEDKDKRCDFVKTTGDCAIDEGFLDYTEFVYCDFGQHLLPLGMIILFLWWIFLFIGLAVTADDFFCPALSVIAETMHLSHNIAGVTFLAFGNGAPDIFSAIAAIGNAKNGDAGLAIGALFGAGVFVTTVVAGTISVICPFKAMERPFLRDVIFYLAATFWSFSVLWKKKITKIEAIGFILMYVGYVLVVVLGRYIYQKSKNNSTQLEDVDDEDSPYQNTERTIRGTEKEPLLSDKINVSTECETVMEEGSPWQEFRAAINPIDIEKWPEMKLYGKIYEVFKAPIVFLLIVTVPVVDKAEDKHKWNRHLNSLQCVTGLVFCSLATKLGFNTLGSTFPVWALVLIIGAGLGVLVFSTSRNDVQPKYHAAFAYFGFLVAFVWIYSVANEIVNILQTFGIVLNISNAILGLTLLAWGNSIGDLIADTVMARQGFPRMGISACFGGPLFNMLLGIGIPFTIGTIKQGKSYDLKLTFEEVVLAGFLLLSLITSLVIVPLSKFRMTRKYGVILIVLYVVFLVVAILAETNVIDVKV